MSAAVNVTATPAFCREGVGQQVREGGSDRREHASYRDVRPEDREVHADPHLLPDASRAIRGRRHEPAVLQSAGRRASRASAGSTSTCSTRQATSRPRRDGAGSTSTWTATDGPTAIAPVPGGPYSVIQSPIDGSLWGAVTTHAGHIVRLSLGSESAGDLRRRDVRSSVRSVPVEDAGRDVRLPAARHRRRQQRRRVDRPRRQRSPRQLRPPQVQGADWRERHDGPTLRRGMDALSDRRPEDAGRDR